MNYCMDMCDQSIYAGKRWCICANIYTLIRDTESAPNMKASPSAHRSRCRRFNNSNEMKITADGEQHMHDAWMKRLIETEKMGMKRNLLSLRIRVGAGVYVICVCAMLETNPRHKHARRYTKKHSSNIYSKLVECNPNAFVIGFHAR